ncbi:histidine phosphatase family protein [uncultured Lactobacillus sp.]|uniref:histidine phosphatase family protein n=1 Tax=uncultured Lactobacillus sp. TaxID=153152 RepID=UPI002630F8E0|nr:histidine phosphatase family protein [uncultured Lactobacillus sp.]
MQDIPDGKNVLIVSHAGTIMNFLVKELSASVLLHVKHFGNCGVLVLTYDGQKFTLKAVINPAEGLK